MENGMKKLFNNVLIRGILDFRDYSKEYYNHFYNGKGDLESAKSFGDVKKFFMDKEGGFSILANILELKREKLIKKLVKLEESTKESYKSGGKNYEKSKRKG